jgi:very-short-patch-repair endonuclease
LSHLTDTLLMQLKLAKVPMPTTEYKFHDTRKWRFDLCYPAQMLAVEVDGGTWAGGRHTRGKGFEDDCEKLNVATLAGWIILRVTGKHIESGEALKWIEEGLQS